MVKAVEYDDFGHMSYHPKFHDRHGTRFTEEELEYLCKFYECDGFRSMSLALGRTERTTIQKVANLKKEKVYRYYRELNKHW